MSRGKGKLLNQIMSKNVRGKVYRVQESSEVNKCDRGYRILLLIGFVTVLPFHNALSLHYPKDSI